jgi:hypothetical protein
MTSTNIKPQKYADNAMVLRRVNMQEHEKMSEVMATQNRYAPRYININNNGLTVHQSAPQTAGKRVRARLHYSRPQQHEVAHQRAPHHCVL